MQRLVEGPRKALGRGLYWGSRQAATGVVTRRMS